MTFEELYAMLKRQNGDGPSSGNQFGGYGSPGGALDAYNAGTYGNGATAPTTMAMQQPQALPPGVPQPPPGGQTPLAGPVSPLASMAPAGESPVAMSQRYAQALLAGASPPSGWQSVTNTPPPYSPSMAGGGGGMAGAAPNAAADERLRRLLAEELAKQQPAMPQQLLGP